MRVIGFIGNCQLAALKYTFDRFVRPHTGDTSFYVATYDDMAEADRQALAAADTLVLQRQDFATRARLPAMRPGVATHEVPVVSGGFLWPYGGQAHPRNITSVACHCGPYGPENGDSFLNRLIREGVDPDDAVQRYLDHDIAAEIDLDRLLRVYLHKQRRLDGATGFDVAGLIERSLRDEMLFHNAYHPAPGILRHLACGLFARMGVAPPLVERVRTDMMVTNIPRHTHPIHPGVVRHFGLSFIAPEPRYQFLDEGRFGFADWVRRYMVFAWNPLLAETLLRIERGERDDAALLALESALAASPGSATGHAVRGDLLTARGRLDEAIAALRTAIALDPDAAPPHAYLGVALLAQGNTVESLGALDQAIKLDPAEPVFRLFRAQALDKAGRLSEVRLATAEALRLDPGNREVALQHGHGLVNLGLYDEAAAVIEAAAARRPEDPTLPSFLAHILAGLGRLPEALGAAARALALAPDTAAYHAHLGHLLASNGQLEAAADSFAQACRLDRADTGLLYSYAHVLFSLRRLAEAREVGAEAIRLAPRTASFHALLGHVNGEMGESAASEAAFRRALELEPGNAANHDLHAMVLERLGRIAQAISSAARAVELAPDIDAYRRRLVALQSRLARMPPAVRAAAGQP